MGKHRHVSHHHRKCRSNGGNGDKGNLVEVDRDRHNFWHAMFRNMKPDEIVDEINSVWIDPEFKVMLLRR
jgi:hypothetical protein